MIKNDLVSKVQQGVEEKMSKRDAADLVDQVFAIIKEGLAHGDTVLLSKFGRFYLRHRGERMGRNPQTGKPIVLSARRGVAFKASGVLRRKVNIALGQQRVPDRRAAAQRGEDARGERTEGATKEQYLRYYRASSEAMDSRSR